MAITVDQLRSLVGDVDTPPIMADEQYEVAIDIEPSNYYDAAAIVSMSLAGLFATKVKITAGPASIENQQKYEHYLDLAKTYRQLAREGKGGVNGGVTALSAASPLLAGISISEMESVRSDPDRYTSKIYRGMQDNPQEYTDNEYGEDIY